MTTIEGELYSVDAVSIVLRDVAAPAANVVQPVVEDGDAVECVHDVFDGKAAPVAANACSAPDPGPFIGNGSGSLLEISDESVPSCLWRAQTGHR